MPIIASITRRAWFWPALLVAAIAAGAIVEWVREPAPPEPGTPRTNVPAPGTAAPGSARLAPGAAIPPGLPRAPESPETPPLIHAEIPQPHLPPGMEPPVPLTANRTMDPKRVLDNSARRWADSVRGARPDILEQMRLGKLQERERLQKELAGIEESLRASPGSEALSRQIESLRNKLYYLDRSIGYLEQVQAETR